MGVSATHDDARTDVDGFYARSRAALGAGATVSVGWIYLGGLLDAAAPALAAAGAGQGTGHAAGLEAARAAIRESTDAAVRLVSEETQPFALLVHGEQLVIAVAADAGTLAGAIRRLRSHISACGVSGGTQLSVGAAVVDSNAVLSELSGDWDAMSAMMLVAEREARAVSSGDILTIA